MSRVPGLSSLPGPSEAREPQEHQKLQGHPGLPCPRSPRAVSAPGSPVSLRLPELPGKSGKRCTIRDTNYTIRDRFDRMGICFIVKASRITQLLISYEILECIVVAFCSLCPAKHELRAKYLINTDHSVVVGELFQWGI